MAPPRNAANIALEEVTQAAFNGVLRSLGEQKIPIEKWPGPILIGIIAWPQMKGGGELFGNVQTRGRGG